MIWRLSRASSPPTKRGWMWSALVWWMPGEPHRLHIEPCLSQMRAYWASVSFFLVMGGLQSSWKASLAKQEMLWPWYTRGRLQSLANSSAKTSQTAASGSRRWITASPVRSALRLPTPLRLTFGQRPLEWSWPRV